MYLNLSISNLVGGSGSATILGLPFNASNTPANSYYCSTIMGDDNWSTNLSGTNLIAYVSGNYQPDRLVLRKNSGSNMASIDVTDIGTSRVVISISYSTV